MFTSPVDTARVEVTLTRALVSLLTSVEAYPKSGCTSLITRAERASPCLLDSTSSLPRLVGLLFMEALDSVLPKNGASKTWLVDKPNFWE